jgi:Putative MetA-pathway of phenol degradation
MRSHRNITRVSRLLFFPFVLTAAFSLTGGAASAEEKDVIVTDRPDFVESSDVVGRGRFQIETGIAIERNNAGGFRDRTFTTPTLLRIGTGEAWELRVETDGRTVVRTDDISAGTRSTLGGYSDFSLGVKWHVADAEGSRPSMGLLGHVDVDSGSTGFRGNGLRPSLRMAAEWDLPNDLSLGVMPGVMLDKTSTGKRFTSGIFGAVLGKSWNERFRTFVEISAPQIARTRNGGTLATFDVGAAYLLSDMWQLDGALYKGLNRNTADLAFGIGLSAKF